MGVLLSLGLQGTTTTREAFAVVALAGQRHLFWGQEALLLMINHGLVTYWTTAMPSAGTALGNCSEVIGAQNAAAHPVLGISPFTHVKLCRLSVSSWVQFKAMVIPSGSPGAFLIAGQPLGPSR